MSSGARNYGPYPVLVGGNMAGNLSTMGIDFLTLPFGSIELIWTGTPTGTFSVDGSIDNVPTSNLITKWYPTGTYVNNPAGSPSSTLINLMGIGFRWLRISYIATGGTGLLNVNIFGKGAR